MQSLTPEYAGAAITAGGLLLNGVWAIANLRTERKFGRVIEEQFADLRKWIMDHYVDTPFCDERHDGLHCRFEDILRRLAAAGA